MMKLLRAISSIHSRCWISLKDRCDYVQVVSVFFFYSEKLAKKMQNRTRQIDTWYSLLVYISIAYDEWFYHNFVMFRSQNLHHKNTHQSNANSENSISYQNFVFAYFYVLLHIFVRCTVEFYIFFFIFRLLANDTLRWFVVIALLTVLVHLNSFVCAVIFTIFLLGHDLFFFEVTMKICGNVFLLFSCDSPLSSFEFV